jgi:hypothetical protein
MAATKKTASNTKQPQSEPEISAEDAPISARPARRADLTGQGRQLDALGNER